jgi:polar amino acid transport system substrate-binding protein
MSITAARQQRVAFTQPYLKIGQMALVRADEQYRYVPLGASRGAQPIGLMKGTTAELFLQQEFPRAQRKYFDSGESAAKALLKKKLNLYLSDSTIVYYLAGKHQADGLAVAPMILSEEMLAWAVRRSDTELLESVNRSLKSMLESGEVKKLIKRWIPQFE